MIVSLVLIGGCLPLVACAWNDTAPATHPVVIDASEVKASAPAAPAGTVKPASPDPLKLLEQGRQRCHREVRDYTCVFLRQERLDGKLNEQQSINVRYRDEPQSVYMTWTRNAGRVKRALYVKGRIVDKQGQENATVEPAGAIARLFVSKLDVPIHGKEARKSGRFTIDQFGFRSVLDRITRDNKRYADLGGLQWTHEGNGRIDGRPTHKLVRHLPYTGPGGQYSDARLVVHLDQEWLLPVAVYSYGDEQEKELLGSYITTHLALNPGLSEADFQF